MKVLVQFPAGRFAVVLAIALGLALLPAVAAAAVNLSNSPNWASYFPRIAFDANGDGHVVWMEEYGTNNGDIFYARLTKSTGTWSAPVNLSGRGRCWAQSLMICAVAVDGLNRVHVAYAENDGVRLRTLTAGSWSDAIQVYEGGNSDGTRVAADSSGDVYVAWYDQGRRVIHSRARIGGNWEEVLTISNTSRGSKFCDIAVGSSEAWAVWVQKTAAGDRYETTWARRGKSLNAGWTSPAPLVSDPNSHQHPSIEVDSSGFPHVVYTPVYSDENRTASYAYWTGSGFSSARSLSEQTMLHWPSLAIRNDVLFCCWQNGAADNGSSISTTTGSRATWSAPISAPSSNGSVHADIAGDSAGKIALVYNSFGDIYYYSTGTAGAPANRAPVADFVFSPQTGIAPLTVTFDGSASYDPDQGGQIVRYDWQFGDGTTGSGRTVNHNFDRRGTYIIKLTVIDDKGASGSRTASLQVLGLFAPLNVAWATYVDRSLFQTRFVNEVVWEANPGNDAVAVVVRYRIYRRDTQDEDGGYSMIGEVDGATFKFVDQKVSEAGRYLYAVSSLDSQGHESPRNDQDDNANESSRAAIETGAVPPPRIRIR